MKIVRDFNKSDGIEGVKNCRNCKFSESGADLSKTSPYDYSKEKKYKGDYFCKKQSCIVNSTSVCDKWKNL